jgi:hypothetical protein
MVIRRDKRVQMLFSQEEWAMLQEMADRQGVTASDWVRMKIREAYGPAEPPKRKPKSKR